MDHRLYWQGNAAKTRIIDDILRSTRSRPDEKILVFDYGCGAGGDWPAILSDHRQLSLVGYDPSHQSIQVAKQKLTGLAAELFTGNELKRLNFKADFIVSFSVLEHVYDRRTYLEKAKSLLADTGTFYLNYDDGHFRNVLDLNAPRQWPDEIGVWLHNLMAEPMARMGRVAHFQKRVSRGDIDQLIVGLGFRVSEVFYSNLASLKSLYNTIPADKRQEFSRIWVALENDLNDSFSTSQRHKTLGDNVNLWQHMGSRTVVLRHH